MPLLGNEKKELKKLTKEMGGLRIKQSKNINVLQKSFEFGFPFQSVNGYFPHF